jgi:hypothetical protein
VVQQREEANTLGFGVSLVEADESCIYREVKPTSRCDRDINKLSLEFRLSYLAHLGPSD